MHCAECFAAARTKLKKLQKEAAAKAQAAANDLANKGPKERSPHTKEVRSFGAQHNVFLVPLMCRVVRNCNLTTIPVQTLLFAILCIALSDFFDIVFVTYRPCVIELL